ncbi:rhodanese-like domain-containing protein [Thiococcus pfennigii]|uniref:rhodanese-like domain-containing protein n=1 Tax=Thiococcus pfennigii TaxID=1057 RepID=UPI00190435BA
MSSGIFARVAVSDFQWCTRRLHHQSWFRRAQQVGIQGFPVPETSPVQGVARLHIEQLDEALADNANVFIDVRPPAFFDACRLKGSVNLEYTFSGPQGEKMYKTDRRVTEPVLEEFIAQGRIIVFFCNDSFSARGCHRAANAVITAVCDWGLPTNAVKWFGEVVSGTVPTRPDLVEGTKCEPPWH